jgi:nitrite reductase (NADH) large subunit
MHLLIIGNGAAAVAAAEAARQGDAGCRITLVSRETEPFYSPCPLAEYVEASLPREHLFQRNAAFYKDQGITT